jgi:signal transduction histidine kinase
MNLAHEGNEGDRMAARDLVESGMERSLDHVLRASAAVLALCAAIGPKPMPPLSVGMNVAFAVVIGLSYALLRRGRSTAAGALLSGGFWVVVTVGVFAFGGLRSPALFVYLPVLVTASIFWSNRAVVGLAVATLLVAVLAFQLEALGALPRPATPVTAPRVLTIFFGALLMTAVLLTVALRHVASIRRALSRSGQRSDALEQRLESAERFGSIGRAAGGAAHDFNNLLSVILNSAALLERQLGPESSGYRFARDITDAGMRASTLTRKLLAFGRRRAPAETVNLNEALADMSSILVRLVGEGRDLRLCTEARSPSVRIDRAELEQVILNLVTNARDAMPDGGRITVRTGDASPARGAEGAPSGYASLVVEDEGVGMDEATRARIFEPFYTTKELGTGIGLPTVRDIVRQSGGRIDIHSEPHRGTRFEVLLPRAELSSQVRTKFPVPESRPAEVRAEPSFVGIPTSKNAESA